MIKGCNGNIYEKVKLREKWIDYLLKQKLQTESNLIETQDMDFSHVEKPIEKKLTLLTLDNIIQYHIKNMNNHQVTKNDQFIFTT